MPLLPPELDLEPGILNSEMYKNQLQEYAQKASLQLPHYETIREGPHHMSKFRSTVTVNGVRYESLHDFSKRKSAENAAAQVAFEAIVKKVDTAGIYKNQSQAALETIVKKLDGAGMYKNQLQEYAQKAYLLLPVYETIQEGPPHMPKFRSIVTVNGVRYDSPHGFDKRKSAENAAAQVALEDIVTKVDGGPIPSPVESAISKTLLDDYTKRMSLPPPNYNLEKSGITHSPTFSSIVEIAGVPYSGGPAHTKKGAESKAAQAALRAIQAQAYNSRRNRERDMEVPLQEGKVVKFGLKTIADESSLQNRVSVERDSRPAENNFEKFIMKDDSAVPINEPERQPCQKSCAVQGQLKNPSVGVHQGEEQGPKDSKEKQQGAKGGAQECSSVEGKNQRQKTVPMKSTNTRDAKRIGQFHRGERKSQRSKRARKDESQ